MIVIISGLGIVGGFWKLDDFLSYIPQFLIGAVFVVIFWGVGQDIKNALGKKEQTIVDKVLPFIYDPIYRNLAVYYHRVKATSDTPDSAQLKYLADGAKGKAYLMREIPEWLAPAIKKHNILWRPYDDERVLNKYIKANFSLSDLDPSPEIVGLTYSDGVLIEDMQYCELLSKLAGNRLEDLQIARVNRRKLLSVATRTLLIDFSAKKVWLAPPYWYLLIDKKIINSESYGMHFWESCKKWSKRKFGFELVQNHYPESQLLSKATVKQSS